MATNYTASRSAEWFLSGTIGATNAYTQAGALGGSHLVSGVPCLAAKITNGLSNARLDFVSLGNTAGSATLIGSDTDELTFTGVGDTAGTAVTYAATETLLVNSNDTDMAITVTKTDTNNFDTSTEMQIELLPVYNNAVAMGNVPNADRASGEDYYRAVYLRTHPDATPIAVTSVKIWLDTLGTVATSDTTQLGASGSGTIETTDSYADWPAAGWVNIDNAGTTREIAFYTSRTATVLTIPAAGRGLLGTSAGAGAGTDTVTPVPGIRIAKEVPVGGVIQTIADELTAPTGLTWDTGITNTTGLTEATLDATDGLGLWIHKEIPVGIVPGGAKYENAINYSFVAGGVTYTGVIRGLYRVADTTIEKYELYVGEDAAPDFTAAPATTSATLPITHALTPPGAGNKTFRYVTRFRNRYNLLSQNIYERSVTIDSGGAVVGSEVSDPYNVTATETEGGEIVVQAYYNRALDSSPADTFNIYLNTDGTDPDPAVDTPVATHTMTVRDSIGSVRTLSKSTGGKELGPYGLGAPLKIIVTVERSSDNEQSANVTATSLTITKSAPAKPAPNEMLFGSVFGERQTTETYSNTITYDVGTNTRSILTNNSHAFYVGSTLVFRILYDQSDTDGDTYNGVYVPSTLILDATSTIATAGTAGPVEVVSATEIYINAVGVRTVKIDLSANKIQATQFEQNATDLTDKLTPFGNYGIIATGLYSLLRVYDTALEDLVSVCEIDDDSSGQWLSTLRWDLTKSQATIEAL
jgi:hypothetical protein